MFVFYKPWGRGGGVHTYTYICDIHTNENTCCTHTHSSYREKTSFFCFFYFYSPLLLSSSFFHIFSFRELSYVRIIAASCVCVISLFLFLSLSYYINSIDSTRTLLLLYLSVNKLGNKGTHKEEHSLNCIVCCVLFVVLLQVSSVLIRHLT